VAHTTSPTALDSLSSPAFHPAGPLRETGLPRSRGPEEGEFEACPLRGSASGPPPANAPLPKLV
jgi:hypothetical protein